MKFIKLFLSLLIVSSLLLTSCKDEDKTPDPSNTNKTNTQKLVASNWLLTKATFNPPIVTTIGMQNFTFNELFEIPLIEDCQKDNLIIFNADSTMTIDNGALKCGTEPQTAKDGNWRFISNETQIEITNSAYFSLINANKVIIDKVVITDTEMKGETDYVFTNPLTQVETTSKINFTFTKK